MDGSSDLSAVNWRVAQGAHMQNVRIVMPTSGPTGGHTGIFVGQGSSLGVSDVRVERGWNGIWHQAHQQMAYKDIEFFQNTRGMRISGGNVVTITGSTFDAVYKAVTHDGGCPWIAMVDCKSINSEASFSTTQYSSILIDNLERDDDRTVVEWNNETFLNNTRHVDQFTYANTYSQRPVYGPNKDGSSKRPGALVQGGKYLSIVAPNYADKTTSDFINVKDPKQNADRLPGAILTQVNMAGNAAGDVAIWNSMITFGGTAGSDGINKNCYDNNDERKGALLGLHLSRSSSAYVENTWVWVADHNSEGGGALVQATKGTWLHALGSKFEEHKRKKQMCFQSKMESVVQKV
ncbi:hypothetical protein J3458_019979 [Metarhizium acridum]|uniref:uncharacterized protein n=1 Tax=Metarhizium acridum TaxID=92637 RepID=UPI001C6B11AD|nr:hypothetical protein J3458_019979 [Metarhizium acridum]